MQRINYKYPSLITESFVEEEPEYDKQVEIISEDSILIMIEYCNKEGKSTRNPEDLRINQSDTLVSVYEKVAQVFDV